VPPTPPAPQAGQYDRTAHDWANATIDSASRVNVLRSPFVINPEVTPLTVYAKVMRVEFAPADFKPM